MEIRQTKGREGKGERNEGEIMAKVSKEGDGVLWKAGEIVKGVELKSEGHAYTGDGSKK